MTKKKFKVVVFDCDGVLFDSREANVKFYNTILEKFGLDKLKPYQEDFVHMHSAKESISYLIPDKEMAKKAWEYALTLKFEDFFPYMKPQPYLKECLSALHKKFHIAMATNRTVSTHEVLEYFDLKKYFDYVVCASDVKNPKPNKDMMNMIIKHFHVQPYEIVYVGDSKVDEIFAQNAKVVFAAFKNPSLKAVLHIENFDELVRWLLN